RKGRLAAEGVKLAPHLHEHVLGNVLGVGVVTEHAPREMVHARRVIAKDPLGRERRTGRRCVRFFHVTRPCRHGIPRRFSSRSHHTIDGQRGADYSLHAAQNQALVPLLPKNLLPPSPEKVTLSPGLPRAHPGLCSWRRRPTWNSFPPIPT